MSHTMSHTTTRTRSARRLAAGGAALLAAGSFAFLAPSVGAKGGNPPGANGTVKVDAQPFDTHPNNQPHVGCQFQVDFYGFDQGDHTAHVAFDVHAPTGDQRIVEDFVPIGEDPAGGGTDLDAERTYDLGPALAGFTPHPKQGYHVKLTVSAPGAGGKVATKHKVFWVEGCEAPCTPDPYSGQTCGYDPEPS